MVGSHPPPPVQPPAPPLLLNAPRTLARVVSLQVRVGFKWGDAFNPNKKSTQSTLLFERTCVLYNLGAHESRSASEEDRATESVRVILTGGVQEAIPYFLISYHSSGDVFLVPMNPSQGIDLTPSSIIPACRPPRATGE